MFNFLKFLIVFIQLRYILNQKFLSHEKCGKMDNTNSFGWITDIVLSDKTQLNNYGCKANFITEEWLISTASCLRNYKNASYYKIKLPNKSPNMEPLEIEKIVKSPEYNPTLGAGYDIALIKLKTAQQFEPNQIHTGLYPICVPDWGDSKSTFTPNDCHLNNENNKIPVTVDLTNKNCFNSYKKRFNPKNMICAEVPTNICNRNHGSPLMCYDSNDDKVERLYLVGIASWKLTDASCNGKIPDVFTKLYSNDYTKWINKTINDRPLLVH